MRVFLFALAALCAACSPLAGHKGGYNLEIRASDDAQFFLVTTPDGHVVGARASKGQSAMMDDDAIHALLATTPAAATTSATDTSTGTSTNPNNVSIQAPGVSIQASGDDNGKDNGDAHVTLGGGNNGPGIHIDAHGNGDSGNAHVVINGVDAKTAHDFITGADDLSSDTKAQMLAALGMR